MKEYIQKLEDEILGGVYGTKNRSQLLLKMGVIKARHISTILCPSCGHGTASLPPIDPCNKCNCHDTGGGKCTDGKLCCDYSPNCPF